MLLSVSFLSLHQIFRDVQIFLTSLPVIKHTLLSQVLSFLRSLGFIGGMANISNHLNQLQTFDCNS